MTQKTFVTVSLNSEADRDIIRWLDRQENRSGAIREAIRDRIGRCGVSLGDVYQAVKSLERKIEAGAVIVGQGDPPGDDDWDEPPEAAAALDRLAEIGG